MAKAKVCASRKRMHQVMNNAGFGDTVVIQGNVIAIVPQKAIKKSDGAVKKAVGARLMDIAQMSIAEAQHLHTTYGVEVTTA